MAEETRIVKIEIDQQAALKDLEATETAILKLKEEQKELNAQMKAGAITTQEYAAAKVQLDQKIASETANRKTLTQAINTESNSLDTQRLKLKNLIAERDKIDRSTVEGAKKFDDMNKSINSLNTSIKGAEAAGGSFQRNVGNYKGTIDSFTGGAYSAAEGLVSMTRASLAFIATPIGAIIAAIGIALSSLVAYFEGSEEGQNKLNVIMSVGGQIMERIMDVVEDLGEAVYNAFSNPKQAMIDLFNFLKDNIINRFTAFAVILEGITTLDFKKVANGVIQAGTGIENVIDKTMEIGKQASKVIDKAVEDGIRLANRQAEIDKKERQMIEDSAKRKFQISELRRKADESEGQAKLDFLNQALELEKVEAEQTLSNAQLKRDQAVEEAELNGKTKEALDKVAKAEADLFNAKTAYFDNTRKMNKERLATEKEIDDQIVKRIDSDQKLQFQESQRVAEAEKKADEELGKAFERIQKKSETLEESLMIDLDAVEAEADAEQKAADQTFDNYKENEEKKREEAQKTRDAIVAGVMATGDVIGDIFSKVTAIQNHEADLQLQKVKLNQQAELAALQDKLDKGEISEEEFKEAKAEIDKQAAKEADDIKRKAFDANKKNKIADSIIDAVQSSIAAFRSLVGIPVVGPALAAIAAAAALAYGYKQVDLIRSEQYVPGSFSIGGYTGPGDVNDPAGIVHKGEVVWNQQDVAAVGGPQVANRMRPTFALRGYQTGGVVTQAMTNQIDSSMLSQQASPPIYTSWTEWKEFNDQMTNKAKIVEA